MRTIARSMADVAVAGLVLDGANEEQHSGARIKAHAVPTALRSFWVDGLFASASDAFMVTYLPLLALALGASATQVGLLAAGQNLGALLALYPGALAARRMSRRWMVVFFAGTLGRGLLLVAAGVVAFLNGQTALYLIIAIFGVRAFLGSFTVPAWTSLAADVIPEHLRSNYFASRNFAIGAATLVLTPVGGLLLDRAGMPGGWVAAMVVSFALGMVATVAYQRIPEPEVRPREVTERKLQVGVVLRNGTFMRFLVATFALQFAAMISGPFFNVYLKDVMGASNFAIGWLTTVTAVASLGAPLLCGVWLTRRGTLWVSRISLAVLPVLPLIWLLVTAPWMSLVPNLLGGFFWAAFNQANFQQLLETTPEEDREGYVAVFHMGMFGALFLAPFLGGLIIDHLGYHTAFVVSGLGRLVSTGMFLFMVGTPVARLAWGRRAVRGV